MRAELSVDTYSPFLNNFGATEFDVDYNDLGQPTSQPRYNGQEDDFRVPVRLSSRSTSFVTDGLTVLDS